MTSHQQSSPYTLPQISTLPNLPTTSLTSILEHLFEPCTALNTLSLGTLRETTFSSYDDLISTIEKQLIRLKESRLESDQEWLLKILAAHPRLGAKKVESEHSKGEQASLAGGGEEAEKLKLLNDKYERVFPGMRYVVFVAGRSRDVIMRDMKSRISRGDIEAEKLEAINAMADIAMDRVKTIGVSES